MVTIIDCGLGNTGSVVNMIRKAGGQASRTSRPQDVAAASKLILPGVGAFDHGMELLRSFGLEAAIAESVARGVPLLGICLGMQLLAARSEEGSAPGLGLLDADIRRFDLPSESGLHVPHVGWSEVSVARENPLLPVDGPLQRFYFTHSYHAVCAREEDVLATADYGYRFTAAYSRGNVYGVQFHPEKSHRFGLALMTNFLGL